MPERDYVIWSVEHRAWWRAHHVGYCDTLSDAGVYSEAEAASIVARANIVKFHECMIPVDAVSGGDVLTILLARTHENARRPRP